MLPTSPSTFFSLSAIATVNNNNNNGNLNNNNNPNGYRLLTAQGMETLQTFLREHGNECIKQFVKVAPPRANIPQCVPTRPKPPYDSFA